MRIKHRISLGIDPEGRELVRAGGIRLPVRRRTKRSFIPENLVTFVVGEDNPKWPVIAKYLSGRNHVDIVSTEFTQDELNRATHLQMCPTWHHGYPMPDNDFGYQSETYELKSSCNTCGVNRKQIRPFRMRGEPKWGENHVMQLTWVFDEYFVRPLVWEKVLKPLGIGCMEVVRHRDSRPLSGVVQLKSTEIMAASVGMRAYPSQTCEACRSRKYLPITRGYFPRVKFPKSVHLARTREYFGDGRSAWRGVIVSAKLYRRIRAAKLKGVSFVALGMD